MYPKQGTPQNAASTIAYTHTETCIHKYKQTISEINKYKSTWKHCSAGIIYH